MSTWDVLHVKSLEVEHSVSDADVRQGLDEGRYSRDDCVRRPGEERWWRIYERAEFRGPQAASAEVDDAALMQDGSLRNILGDAEPPQEAARAKRRAPGVVIDPPATAPRARPAPPPTPPREPSEPLFPPKKPAAEQEDIDMAPACTVSFLLILFFVIVSGVAIQMALSFPKPAPDDRAQAKEAVQKNWDDLKKDNIVVEIKGDNSILIDDEPVKEPDLLNRITTLKRDRAATDVIIKAEDAAYHQTVVAVVDAANMAGIQNVKMAAVTKTVKKAKRKPSVRT